VPDKEGLLFRSRHGTPLWSSWFYDSVWRPAVVAAGLPPGTRFHELRHFYASALIRSGESVKTVQAALGHATAVETLETYASLWPDAPERTRAAVDALFSPAMGDCRQPGLHAAGGLHTARDDAMGV
jgi:integrase